MGSPFPGMDPYIEVSHLWEDFHNCLIADVQRVLSEILPDRYVVRTGERSYVALASSDDDEDRHPFVPDVAVASNRDSAKTPRRVKGPAEAAAAAVAQGLNGLVLGTEMVVVDCGVVP